MSRSPSSGRVASVLDDLKRSLTAERERHPKLPDADSLKGWWEQIDGWRAAHGLDHGMKAEAGQPILPQAVVQALYRVTDGKAIVTSDVGQHQMFAAQYYRFREAQALDQLRWPRHHGLRPAGGHGCAVCKPDASVVCITGEGSFMMNMQELSTCLQYGLPIKIVCLNNQALGMVKQWQDMQYGGRHSHSTYSDSLPDFKTLVEAFGHVGFKVERAEDLEASLRKPSARDLKNRTVFVDVWVDPNEHVYPMAIKGGSMQDMYLSKITTSIQGDYM